MAVRKGGLGKGLDSMIPDTSAKVKKKSPAPAPAENTKEVDIKDERSVQLIKMSMIEPNREQPRKQFGEDALLELAESIKQFGILQPLLVQKKGDYYEIIAGERKIGRAHV